MWLLQLVQVILFSFSVQKAEAAFTTVTKTASPNNAETTPPPRSPLVDILWARRDQTISKRWKITCIYHPRLLTLPPADEEGSPPLTCPGRDQLCATSKVRDLGDGIEPLMGVACCPKTAIGQTCVFATSCIERPSPTTLAADDPAANPSVLTCESSSRCNTYIWPQNSARFYSCVPMLQISSSNPDESSDVATPAAGNTDHFVADFYVRAARTVTITLSSSSASTTTATPPPLNSGYPPASGSDSNMAGLSPSQKIGLGVGLPMGFLLVSVFLLWLWWMQRRTKSMEQRPVMIHEEGRRNCNDNGSDHARAAAVEGDAENVQKGGVVAEARTGPVAVAPIMAEIGTVGFSPYIRTDKGDDDDGIEEAGPDDVIRNSEKTAIVESACQLRSPAEGATGD
ncbi:hypothetical protein V8F20_009025 [Naviculisporaceae sp. PSN 640]